MSYSSIFRPQLLPYFYLFDAHLQDVSILISCVISWQIWYFSTEEKVPHFFMAPHLRYKINHLKKIAWRSNILQQPFLKVVRFVLSHALQGINLENLQPPQRNLFSQHSDFADMELSSATSPCGWVGSPSLGRKESHLPCLKADRRVSVPCHMPDSLQDWEFQGKASAERTFILVWQEKQ